MTKIKDVPFEERWPFLARTVTPLLLVSGIGFLFYLGIAGLTGLPSPLQTQPETYEQYLQYQRDFQRGYTLISIVLLFAASWLTYSFLRTRHKKKHEKEVQSQE